jgi:hypothetical protein
MSHFEGKMSLARDPGGKAPVRVGPAPASASRAAVYLNAFVILQIACQVGLLLPAQGKFRVVFRIATFATSLALLALVPGRGKPHPSSLWGVVSITIVALGLFHPSTSTLLAGLAQVGMYLAVLAPLFWVPRLNVTASVLQRVLLLLWSFHTLSAAVGVLQVYFPGRFLPNVSNVVTGMGTYAETLKITLSDGSRVWRPMGLTDTPGGAASAGLYAVLFGLGFLLSSRRLFVRFMAVGSMTVGLFCIYLSQVRSILVMAAVCVVTLVAAALRRGEMSRVVVIAAVVPVVVVASFAWAVLVGGQSVSNRISTLTAESSGQVYYKNRGIFLEYTVKELLPRYPLGAGLGRWGMMSYYFGNSHASEAENIHVEIQMTGWLLDGGVPLIVSYSLAIITAVTLAYRMIVARLPDPLSTWSALILAYDLGAVALTFNYVLFISQGGMEFWLLNASLFAAARSCRSAGRAGPSPPPGAAAPPGPGVAAPPPPLVPV